MSGNILIIDDESSSLKLLTDILSAKGYKIRAFNNGALALRSIAVELPELILLDMRMPVMDGLEVCQRLKENALTKDIPVIFISSATDLTDKIKAFQIGGTDYITKPFHKEEVIARVNVHVSLHRSMQEIKRISEALRKSETRLKMAQTIAHLGHWEWDMQTGVINLSEELSVILGFKSPCDTLSYDNFLQLIHAGDRERVTKQLNEVRKGGDFECEYRIIQPDGSLRVVQSKGKCFQAFQGEALKVFGTIQDETTALTRIKMLGIAQDITKQKELEWQLERQAYTDELTGCHNRRHFMLLAEQEIARVHRYGNPLSLLMLDLDYFKSINDTHGHAVGDLVLKKLIEICGNILRTMDIIGRIGGEEFAIVLPETGRKQAIEVAERLCEAIAAEVIVLDNKRLFHFTASIGVTEMKEDDTTIDEIIKHADDALYKAKHAGRNQVCATL